MLGPDNTVLMNSPFRGMDEIGEVYFIGIGGIGMSAIARFFHSKRVKVSGYDKTPTTLTKELEAAGIAVHYEENLELAPKTAKLIVYTPAIPKEHKELLFYQQNGYRVVKRSDVLQIITQSSFNVCIAGTHGKTTITTMTAHLLRDTGFGCNAFLGGISVNYGTNFWSHERNVCVIEADEYDRSFLKLSPDVAVITAMDADHLDIYGTAESVEQGFIDFSKRVKRGGVLIRQASLKRGNELKADTTLTYQLDDRLADVYAGNIRMLNGSYEFDAHIKGNTIRDVRLNMGGLHNVENSLAAIAVASSLGIENDKIRKAVESFRGVKRRFEYVVKNDKTIYIDDYAHHPEELRALITGTKSLFEGKKCTVIFQPHLFTRTRDFADGFGEVLSLADEVILLPIYPARELPIEGVTSEMILGKMGLANKQVMSKDVLTGWIKNEYAKRKENQVLVTAGAGDIDTLVTPIQKILTETK
jgi:UDP-N-acetylmuramate--alanine ligase